MYFRKKLVCSTSLFVIPESERFFISEMAKWKLIADNSPLIDTPKNCMTGFSVLITSIVFCRYMKTNTQK